MLDLFQPLLTLGRFLQLKKMKLQWGSSSGNPFQYKIYNTMSRYIIPIDILHSYMHLAVQHLHCVALLMLMLQKLIWYKRLPKDCMWMCQESPYKGRQRVGGASEIRVNKRGFQETPAGGGKRYWNVEPVWWCFLKLPHLAWVRMNAFRAGFGCTPVVHWEMNLAKPAVTTYTRGELNPCTPHIVTHVVTAAKDRGGRLKV